MDATVESASPEALSPILDQVVTRARDRAQVRVEALRATYPNEAEAALAQRLVKSFARRAGIGGAATGALSLFALPLGLPAGVAITLATEAELLLALMELHGVDTSGSNGRMKLYAIWIGGGLADAAKSVGLVLGTDAMAAVLAGSLPTRLVARLNPALVRFVLRRLGLGWAPKALKFWPVIGAPLGYAIDSAALKTLGQAAIRTLEGLTPAVARPSHF